RRPSSVDLPCEWWSLMPWPAPYRRSAAEAERKSVVLPLERIRSERECAGLDKFESGADVRGGTMEQFAAVKRSKDGQPVQYLIVDDSVFARKNLGRIIESFGGQVVG